MKIGSNAWKKLIEESLQELGINISDKDTDMFAIHASEMLHWNRRMNLTAITDPKEVALKHFIDAVVPVSMISPDCSMLDIGSGGGFPGLPLKIVMPSINATLVDGSRKKVSFLNHVIRKLKLKNIEAFHIRAEEIENDMQLKNKVDVILSRALSSLKKYFQLALPLVAKDGTIIALKGKMEQKEVDSLCLFLKKTLPLSGKNSINYDLMFKEYMLPGIGAKRTIITLRSISLT